jgi:hypothetical protein
MFKNFYIKRKNPMISIVLLISIFVFGAVLPVSGLKVVGVILQGSGNPGDNLNFKMEVGLDKNDTAMNLTTDILDWKQELDGANQPVESYPSAYSAKDMLTVTPRNFHIEPNGTQELVVEARIPSDATPGGKYAMIGVHRTKDDDQAKGSVRTEVAINTLILITVSEQSLQKVGEITSLTVDKNSAEKIEGSLIFNNTGNVLFKIITEEILKDSSGGALGNVSVESESSILPGAARLMKFSLQPAIKPEPGIYTLTTTARLEDGTLLAEKSIQMEIKS